MADIDYFELSKSTLEELAEKNDSKAMLTLGINYYYGEYGSSDIDMAWDYLSKVIQKEKIKHLRFWGK